MALFDDNSDSRTERPTERRRRQAREQGSVARSVELLVAARLLAIWALLLGWFIAFSTSASSLLREFLTQRQSASEPLEVLNQLQSLVWRTIGIMTWPLIVGVAAALMAHFIQVGWIWRWDNVSPLPSRLSPIGGLQRLLSAATAGRALGLFVKLTLVTCVCGAVISQDVVMLPTEFEDFTGLLSVFADSALRLTSLIAITLLAYGALHYAWQRWKFERSLYMTREEVREEQKELEGNPHLKRRRVAAHQYTLASSLPEATARGPS